MEPIATTDASELRAAAATPLRELAHALVGHDVDDELLAEIAATAGRWVGTARGAPPRRRSLAAYLDDLDVEPPGDGEPVDHYDECAVSGRSNPFSIDMSAVRRGDAVVVRAVFGPAFEGVPGRAHGGLVAAAFDDCMGFLTAMYDHPVVQGELTIRYVAPTPIGEEVEIVVREVERQGRKVTVEAEMSAGGQVTARARGVHVVVDRQRIVASATADRS